MENICNGLMSAHDQRGDFGFESRLIAHPRPRSFGREGVKEKSGCGHYVQREALNSAIGCATSLSTVPSMFLCRTCSGPSPAPSSTTWTTSSCTAPSAPATPRRRRPSIPVSSKIDRIFLQLDRFALNLKQWTMKWYKVCSVISYNKVIFLFVKQEPL